MDDEHRGAAGAGDPVAVVEHLHEVRAADQSASVAQERHQHRPAPQGLQVEPATVEDRQLKRGRGVAGCR